MRFQPLSQQVRRGLGLLSFILGLVLFVWGALPAMSRNSWLIILPNEMGLSEAGEVLVGTTAAAAVPAVLEVRRVSLEAPLFLRTGEEGKVRLSFVPETGPAKTADSAGLQDIFETHLVSVEARLEVGGLEVRPTGYLTQTLVPEKPVRFEWKLRPLEAEKYEGTAWFYLRFMPLEGGPATRRPISAQRLVIHPASLMGLSGPQARLGGGVGILLGIVLSAKWLAGLFGKYAKRTL